LLASLLTIPARLSADAAVLVLTCVTLALLRTNPAGNSTGANHLPNDLLVGPRSAARHRAGRIANVSAVKIEPNALRQLLNTILTKTGISAGYAALGTRVAFLDAFDQRGVSAAFDMGVGANHFLHVHDSGLLSHIAKAQRA
jgi:hypothetical protein